MIMTTAKQMECIFSVRQFRTTLCHFIICRFHRTRKYGCEFSFVALLNVHVCVKVATVWRFWNIDGTFRRPACGVYHDEFKLMWLFVWRNNVVLSNSLLFDFAWSFLFCFTFQCPSKPQWESSVSFSSQYNSPFHHGGRLRRVAEGYLVCFVSCSVFCAGWFWLILVWSCFLCVFFVRLFPLLCPHVLVNAQPLVATNQRPCPRIPRCPSSLSESSSIRPFSFCWFEVLVRSCWCWFAVSVLAKSSHVLVFVMLLWTLWFWTSVEFVFLNIQMPFFAFLLFWKSLPASLPLGPHPFLLCHFDNFKCISSMWNGEKYFR